MQNAKLLSRRRHFTFYILHFTFAAFLILHSTFYITPALAQPSSPIQPSLQQEILDYPREAAATGFGLAESSLADVDLRVFAARFAQGALMWVGILVTIFIVYGGFLYMTSSGNQEKTEKAKQVISRAVVGLAIILSSYSLVFFITRRLVRTTFEDMSSQAYLCSAGGGNVTCCAQWNRFQGELGSTPSLCQGATSWSECGDQFGQAWQQSGERADARYRDWQDCFERETERIDFGGGRHLDPNLFD